MSDFLTRMAQVSHGEADIVTPRLPNLFSSVEETAPAETIAPLQQNHAEAATKTMQQPAGVTGSIQAHDISQQHQKTSPSESIYSESIHSESIAEQASTHNVANKTSGKTQDKTEQTPPTATFTSQAANHAVENLATALLQKKSSQPETQQPGHEKTDPLVAEKSQTTTATKVDSILPQSSQPLVPDYKNQQATPQQLLADMPTSTAAVVKQEPDVHINIGRVEVRAQTAAATPAPQPVRAKRNDNSLSLNDYLKRGGGQS